MAKHKRDSKGQQLDFATIEEIKALSATGLSKQTIADRLNVSWATVDKYSRQVDHLEELRDKRRREFIDACWRNITNAIELGNQKVLTSQLAHEEFESRIETLENSLREAGASEAVIKEAIKGLSSLADIPLGQISTYIGTLYDKQALAQGDPTERVEVVSWDDLD